MTFGKTALRCWLPAAALLLALLCPLPVAAARVSTAIPVSVRTDGAAADAVYTVELTPLDAYYVGIGARPAEVGEWNLFPSEHESYLAGG